ncbi:MAG: nitroreductase family protein [Deltaproteobacteria bacterium]|nr:nitroreductase family protein [Deltaproteobacteria bacterium]
MSVKDIILSRRSIRAYKPDPIPKEDLDELLLCLQNAPSASNRQPWKFIIVSDHNLKTKIAELCFKQMFIAEAPYILVGVGNAVDAWRGKGTYVKNWEIVDVAIALDHFTLVAWEKGIGTCWIGAMNDREISELLGIVEPWHIIALMPFGYPREIGNPRGRKPIEQIISYNHF